jgi:hypothetical protein
MRTSLSFKILHEYEYRSTACKYEYIQSYCTYILYILIYMLRSVPFDKRALLNALSTILQLDFFFLGGGHDSRNIPFVVQAMQNIGVGKGGEGIDWRQNVAERQNQ